MEVAEVDQTHSNFCTVKWYEDDNIPIVGFDAISIEDYFRVCGRCLDNHHSDLDNKCGTMSTSSSSSPSPHSSGPLSLSCPVSSRMNLDDAMGDDVFFINLCASSPSEEWLYVPEYDLQVHFFETSNNAVQDRSAEFVKVLPNIGSDHIEFLKIKAKLKRRSKLSEEERIGLSSYMCILVHSEFSQPFLYRGYKEMLETYPEVCEFDLEEWDAVLLFCNAMKVCSYLIPGKLHKQLIISTCAIVEGLGVTYITGSGATKQTQLRVLIYEREYKIIRGSRKRKKKEEEEEEGEEEEEKA